MYYSFVPKTDVFLGYDKQGNIYFTDGFGMMWTHGIMAGELLFLYYGYYNGGYYVREILIYKTY